MAIRVEASATGPLFETAVTARVETAIADIVREVTELGVQRLTSAFPTGVPVVTGNLRRNVHPTIAGPMAQIDSGGVVYGAWIEGTSSRNESTRFKGYATYRRATQYLNDEVVPAVVDKRAKKLARELGG